MPSACTVGKAVRRKQIVKR